MLKVNHVYTCIRAVKCLRVINSFLLNEEVLACEINTTFLVLDSFPRPFSEFELSERKNAASDRIGKHLVVNKILTAGRIFYMIYVDCSAIGTRPGAYFEELIVQQ